MTPVKDVSETGEAGDVGTVVDAKAMDAEQAARRRKHPFQVYTETVIEKAGLTPTQSTREVVSAVCGDVARLAIVTKEDLEEQAAHIGELIAKERAEMGDRQLWKDTATKVAKLALELRLEGKGVVADPAARA